MLILIKSGFCGTNGKAVETKIKLGISSCLLGEKVRYDGGHRWDRFITETMGRYIEFVPVCPEVGCGLGIPREPLRLVGNPDAPRLMTEKTKKDYTQRMKLWAHKRVAELKKEKICGFIFKSNSPCCGIQQVKVYNKDDVPLEQGVGLFAKTVMEHLSLIPVEDNDRLHVQEILDNFIKRAFSSRGE